MWRRSTIFLFGMALSGSSLLWAQQVPGEASLVARKRWVDFAIVQGRLIALNARQGKSQAVAEGESHPGVQEHFALNVNDGLPSLRYELVDQQQRLTIDIVDGRKMSIRREPHAGSTLRALTFHQPVTGRLTLVIDKQVIHAPTLWHLLLDHPDICRDELLPAFELLRPHWQLETHARQLEEALFQMVDQQQLPAREQMDQLIARLGDASFQRRQAADYALRALGQPVLAYLEELDPATLDSEQRLRVRRIRQHLAVQTGDTPQGAAAWLVNSRAMWIVLLGHPQAAKRDVAAGHLSRLCRQPIAFDPRAEQHQRQEQIARLRTDALR